MSGVGGLPASSTTSFKPSSTSPIIGSAVPSSSSSSSSSSTGAQSSTLPSQPPSQPLSADDADPRSRERRQLLQRTSDALKQVQVRFAGKTEISTGQESQVSLLCAALEAIFAHGLRRSSNKKLVESTLRLLPLAIVKPEANEGGWWLYLRACLDPRELERCSKLPNITTDIGRARAWLRIALNEHMLDKYFGIFARNQRLTIQHYEDYAFLADEERVGIVKNLLVGLNSVVFALQADDLQLNNDTTTVVEQSRTNAIAVSNASSTASGPDVPAVVPAAVYMVDANAAAKPKKKAKKKRVIDTVESAAPPETTLAAHPGMTALKVDVSGAAVLTDTDSDGELTELPATTLRPTKPRQDSVTEADTLERAFAHLAPKAPPADQHAGFQKGHSRAASATVPSLVSSEHPVATPATSEAKPTPVAAPVSLEDDYHARLLASSAKWVGGQSQPAGSGSAATKASSPTPAPAPAPPSSAPTFSSVNFPTSTSGASRATTSPSPSPGQPLAASLEATARPPNAAAPTPAAFSASVLTTVASSPTILSPTTFPTARTMPMTMSSIPSAPPATASTGTGMSASELKLAVLAMTRRKDELQGENTALHAKVDEQQVEIRALADENANLRQQLSHYRESVLSLQQECDALKGSIAQAAIERENAEAALLHPGKGMSQSSSSSSLSSILSGRTDNDSSISSSNNSSIIVTGPRPGSTTSHRRQASAQDGTGDAAVIAQQERKLIQLAQMNQDLLELNQRLYQQASRTRESDGDDASIYSRQVGGPYSQKRSESILSTTSTLTTTPQLVAARSANAYAGQESYRPSVSTVSKTDWVSDSDAKECALCDRGFSFQRRKHHCRSCGGVFCARCADNYLPMSRPGSTTKTVRVCDTCAQSILAKP
ncbi:hypothetical protein CAOG_08891 [Capsaspora owczarzaki ATCC 30864]|uniref:RUN and FYVE domain-containing protein 2 n=1 Tax=Capsaspora owczarzaki (strain ATCC 30864) TaxID=595528 RepID=A0A0D2UIA1_CAPO3|nr:hypothetical protein CAOG_08891 [Capsaspora owczarzaki ATCC 30864]KJE94861.1 hypothetical protein, variant [Capsaspora owczarzaki ATCC 30864]|eukprot:XP_011270553.1 hypothetical protein CAOG_08891 [Capsaspora owczarzaki ATCC 30864]